MKPTLISVFICLVFLSSAMAENTTNGENNIEIFSKGQKYTSAQEYKLHRLKDTLNNEDYFNENPDEYRRFLEEELTFEKLQQFDETTLREIILALRKKSLNVMNKAANEDLKQMEEMLKEFEMTQEGANSIKLDPDKIKTVIISPSSHQDEPQSSQQNNP